MQAPEKSKYSNMSVDELVKLVMSDNTTMNEMSTEQILEIQKYINAYGSVVTGDQSYINLSIINYREEMLKRQLITALIGYMYRLSFEYRPAECDELELKYERLIKAETSAERIQQLLALKQQKVDEYIKTSRTVVERFLDKNFNYNPDRHVRGAHTSNEKDPERRPKDQVIRDLCKVAKRAPSIEAKMRSEPDKMLEYLRMQSLSTYNNALVASETIDSVIQVLDNPQMDYMDKLTILNRRKQKLDGVVKDMKRITEPLSAKDTLAAARIEPPTDVFYHFTRYITNHYEHLRDICKSLYCEKPDIEFAVIYYDSFKTEEEARKYRIKHQNDFRAATFTVSNNGITLLGPFKENRSRVDFYNKNTEILKQMMEQMELDHKLGKDLMEKSVKKEKTKNMMQNGMDSEGLTKYIGIANEIRGLGAKEVLSKEDKERLFELQREKEQAEVPDNMIAMDVFMPQEDPETGEQRLVRDVLHTQSEEPLYLEDNSPYRDSYQELRVVGEKPEYVKKILKDRFGNTREISVKAPTKK